MGQLGSSLVPIHVSLKCHPGRLRAGRERNLSGEAGQLHDQGGAEDCLLVRGAVWGRGEAQGLHLKVPLWRGVGEGGVEMCSDSFSGRNKDLKEN